VKLDNRPTIALVVFKQPGASTLPVVDAVDKALQELEPQLPGGARFVRIYSQGHIVGVVASDLTRNLAIGAVLAVGVLFWMLGASRGIWALALSIPLSLLLGIAGLYLMGQTLNLLTFGARQSRWACLPTTPSSCWKASTIAGKLVTAGGKALLVACAT
jgi:cobalt-zinc-cadmium resistance protein CzcA